MAQVIYTFRVGPRLFRLAVDAMRSHSLAVERFEPISATTMKGLETFMAMPDVEDLLARAREFDDSGEIRVTLRVQHSQKELFQAARIRAGGEDGKPAATQYTMTVGLLSLFPQLTSRTYGTCSLKEG